MADIEAEEAHNVPVVVDDTASELDSVFSDAGSDTTSLSSSVLKYNHENGRRYHAFREGRYPIPNDEKEQDHMDILGHMFALVLGGKLFLAPIDNPQRILDLGCGTGLWAIDMGDMFPSAQVIGNDLSPIQPGMVSPNVQFEIDDVESDWEYKSQFDFIHSRYLAASIKNWPRLFRQVFQNLKPGGFAEFFDYDFHLHSDDGTLKETHDAKINVDEAMRAATLIGQDPCPGPKLKKWAKETGFINIKEHVFKLPFGPWPKDPNLKEIGAWNQLQALEGIDGWTMRLFSRVLGWSPEEIQVHLARARQDYRNPNIHFYYNIHLVYGQKPEEVKR